MKKILICIGLVMTFIACNKDFEQDLPQLNADHQSVTKKIIDTPYRTQKFIDTPYLGKSIDTPYLGKMIDTPYITGKVIDTPYRP